MTRGQVDKQKNRQVDELTGRHEDMQIDMKVEMWTGGKADR